MESFQFNNQAQAALHALWHTGDHLFLTGRAGTGKSTLVEHFAKSSRLRLVVLASTGVAALRIGGQTIHSFFRFFTDVTPENVRSKPGRPRGAKLYRKLEMIVIDEVSMLRADLLDCIDAFLRRWGPRKGVPFGGVRMVFVGDLGQLPPVVRTEERPIFATHYATPFFFSARVFLEVGFRMIELEEVYRQRDPDFLSMLNEVRSGEVSDDALRRLNSRVAGSGWEQTADFQICLTTTNRQATAINQMRLAALPGAALERAATVQGAFKADYAPTAEVLVFKPGAQVMLLNNDPHGRWANGSLGRILRMEPAENPEQPETVRVRLADNGSEVMVGPFDWSIHRFYLDQDRIATELIGCFTQYPIRLAWAVTIHKSQGQTFEKIFLDLGDRVFASGQLYVGLSRCRSFQGLVLSRPITRRDLANDPRVEAFLAGMRQESLPRVALPALD